MAEGVGWKVEVPSFRWRRPEDGRRDYKEGRSVRPSKSVGKASPEAKAGTRPGGGTGRRNRRRTRNIDKHCTSSSPHRFLEKRGGTRPPVLPPQGLRTTPICGSA